MSFINEMKEKVLAGTAIEALEAEKLFEEPLEELCAAANQIREYYCGNTFDICTIINAKSGRCSEDCKYCAQSAHYNTSCTEYPLLSKEEIVEGAKYNADRGILRYSLVTSGKRISDKEVDTICQVVREIKQGISIRVCGSFGLLDEEQYHKLYNAGLTRIHNNLETSKSYFTNMCTTHTFKDKVTAIKHAQSAGMTVCSGGIFGIGETVRDRVELALSLRELGVKSIPVNLLNPVEGTPYEHNKPLSQEEMERTVAVYRFMLPDAFIRLAGGRGLLPDKGRGCFLAGANAAISGDMLTTAGISIEADLNMINELGFQVEVKNE
ncbi:MAG: biotin synthase BioB [Clostridium sp.]|uniref:biotin synthase BioB n=1 Tax=Clostridium sp. TaxID=1506 RepID=UPI00302E2986